MKHWPDCRSSFTSRSRRVCSRSTRPPRQSMISDSSRLAFLHELDAPAVRADRAFDDLAGAVRAGLRAGNKLHTGVAALTVVRLVLVLHRRLARLAFFGT